MELTMAIRAITTTRGPRELGMRFATGAFESAGTSILYRALPLQLIEVHVPDIRGGTP
jgi:hypothetical protein